MTDVMIRLYTIASDEMDDEILDLVTLFHGNIGPLSPVHIV
jgi:hypothetical protein